MTKTMQINPHLTFKGNCKEAFSFYEEVLDGKILVMMPYGDTPLSKEMPISWREKIVHATLVFGKMRLTAADVLPEHYQKPQGFSVLLSVSEPANADRIFKRLSDGGAVQMEIQKTFWAVRFGIVTDRFGTPWMINCEDPTGAASH